MPERLLRIFHPQDAPAVVGHGNVSWPTTAPDGPPGKGLGDEIRPVVARPAQRPKHFARLHLAAIDAHPSQRLIGQSPAAAQAPLAADRPGGSSSRVDMEC